MVNRSVALLTAADIVRIDLDGAVTVMEAPREPGDDLDQLIDAPAA